MIKSSIVFSENILIIDEQRITTVTSVATRMQHEFTTICLLFRINC